MTNKVNNTKFDVPTDPANGIVNALPSVQAQADPERQVWGRRGPSTGALPARPREGVLVSPGQDVAEMMGAHEWNHTGRLTPRQRPFLLSLSYSNVLRLALGGRRSSPLGTTQNECGRILWGPYETTVETHVGYTNLRE
jgi:hypothetical protein